MARASCDVCKSPVQTTTGGVRFRVGEREVALCAKHARMARQGAATVASHAAVGLARAFGVEREIAGLLHLGQQLIDAAAPPALEAAPAAAAPASPARVEVVQRRRAPAASPDVIDAEYEVIQ